MHYIYICLNQFMFCDITGLNAPVVCNFLRTATLYCVTFFSIILHVQPYFVKFEDVQLCRILVEMSIWCNNMSHA